MTRRGLSLIEVVVVIVVIGVLLALLAPALGSMRFRAQKAGCQAHLRTLGQGLQVYMDRHAGGRYPFFRPAGEWPWVPHPRYPDLPGQLSEVIDAALPVRGVDGEFAFAPPWICPADRSEGPRFGFSYNYLLSSAAVEFPRPGLSEEQRFDIVRGEAEASALFALFTDAEPHRGRGFGSNSLLTDGSVEWVAMTNYEDWE